MLKINGSLIRKIRTERRMTHAELAEKLKMAPSYLLQIERGDRRPSLTAIDRIADELQIDPLLLVEGASPVEAVDPVTETAMDLLLNEKTVTTLTIGEKSFTVPKHVERTVVGIVLSNLRR